MGLLQEIQHLWTKIDPRVIDLPLIQSSYHVPLIIFAYLYLVLECGPRFMKNRPPYSLKTFIKLYNIIQIVANIWLVYDHIDAGLFTNSNLTCPASLDYSYDYTPMRLSRGVWYFFLLKILDFVETGIFVLRKRNNQVSGLHLYHHVSALLLAWLVVRYIAVGPASLNCVINSFIHVITYIYYFLAACGPNIKKSIAPMKQWIIKAQLVQLVIMILYNSQNFLPGCKVVEHWIDIIIIGYLMMNFYLFYNFYQKAKPKRKI
ncbi:Very long chain fatty acid elongase 4 [Formica fusca]